jgi:hypothetical protein
MRWLAGASTGSTIVGTGTAGSNATQLNYPVAISFDSNYNLFVVDRNNNRVQLFNIIQC